MRALGTGKPLGEYEEQSWQSNSGLPQNTVRAIAQTSDGYLWIGTEAGLVRFDGIDFAVFDTGNTPALRSDIISSLQQDADGALWIGTPAGLVREAAGKFTAFGNAEGLPSPIVLALYLTHAQRLLALTPMGAAALEKGRFVTIAGTERLELSEGASLIAEDGAGGRVWIAGPGGTASIARNAGTASTPIAPGAPGQLHALAATADGQLWLGASNGLAVLGGQHAVHPVASAGLPSTDISSLLATPDGGMWIGTAKGLAFCSHGAIKVVRELAGLRVEKLFLDRAGSLWVASSGGLDRITNGKVEHAGRQPQLSGVLSILEDREGSMWFGTDTAGLHILRDQPFSTITTTDGLTARLVRAVFEDHAGTMWIGTSGGGLDLFSAGHASKFPGRLPSNVVLALAETNAAAGHDLWVGTPEGLARVRGTEVKLFTTADGLSDDFVRSLYADRDGALWIGTRNGLSRYKDGQFRSYSRLDGLPSELVGAVVRDRAGVLWVGTLGGLSRMSGDRFQSASPQLDGAVTALLDDEQGGLWVGINGRGLSRLTSQGVVASFAASNLPATIYGMLEDENSDLWLSSRTGVDRISRRSLDGLANKGTVAVTHYGTADGMRISEASGGGHPAAWRAHDGALWFATLDGVAMVHPRLGPHNPVAPLSAIEQVLIDDQPAAPVGSGQAIRVAAGHTRLSIRYAGLNFVAPQGVRYRYMLAGFDKGWVEGGTRRTAFYTNLPPGTYRFLVRCADSDGLWSVAAAEQLLVIEPFFYQTAWFYSLLSIAVAGLGFLVYKWRVVTVEAQYRAVLEERSRIAREIHDTLAQGYVAIAVQLELAERLLASSTEAAALQLKQTRDLVREGLAEARSSIWNLRSQSAAGTLPALLAAHIAVVARRYTAAGIVVKFTVHGAYRPVARSVEEQVLRIGQQAVANAVTHARATLVTAELHYDAGWMELRVTDNGRGMDADAHDHAAGGHFGLQGMRERAARIGAQFALNTAPALGVTIVLRVDLQRTTGKEAP
jgi:ligand-binding sensor domain-containing protein/signal transduction histidine kinase